MNEMPSETQNCPTCRKNMSVRCQARPDTVFPSQMDWWWWCSDCHYPSRPTMGFSLSPADRERWQQTVVEDDVTPDSWASALEVRVAALEATQTPTQAVPDYTALKELLGHPGFSEDSFIDGYNRACRDVRRWIDGQEADHE